MVTEYLPETKKRLLHWLCKLIFGMDMGPNYYLLNLLVSKIWQRDTTIFYSTWTRLIGRKVFWGFLMADSPLLPGTWLAMKNTSSSPVQRLDPFRSKTEPFPRLPWRPCSSLPLVEPNPSSTPQVCNKKTCFITKSDIAAQRRRITLRPFNETWKWKQTTFSGCYPEIAKMLVSYFSFSSLSSSLMASVFRLSSIEHSFRSLASTILISWLIFCRSMSKLSWFFCCSIEFSLFTQLMYLSTSKALLIILFLVTKEKFHHNSFSIQLSLNYRAVL